MLHAWRNTLWHQLEIPLGKWRVVTAKGKRDDDQAAGKEVEQPDADVEGHGAAGEDEVEGGDEDADAERPSNNAKDNRE